MTAGSFRRDVTFLDQEHVLVHDRYKILQPSIEHFRGPVKESSFLQKSDRRGLKNILWVVDTTYDLRNALQLHGVHGVMSNHPIRLRRMTEKGIENTLFKRTDLAPCYCILFVRYFVGVCRTCPESQLA